MSREILGEELKDVLAGQEQSDEAYQPGVLGYDPGLVTLFIMDYLSARQTYEAPLDEELTELLLARPVEDSQAFIDAVIRQASEVRCRDEVFDASLSGLLQALYSQGHNGLTLDLTHFNQYSFLGFLATDLSGKPDELLTVNVVGVDLANVASHTKHCRLHLVEYVCEAGYQAKSCEFEFGSGITYLGKGVESSVFRLHAFDDAVLTLTETGKCNTSLVYRLKQLAGKAPKRSGPHYLVHLKRKGSEAFVKGRGGDFGDDLLLFEDFFKMKNKLLISDGAGGWKEVTP